MATANLVSPVGNYPVSLSRRESKVVEAALKQVSHAIKFARVGLGITGTTLSGLLVGDLVIRITAAGACTCKPVATVDTLPDDPADTDYLIVLRAS